MSDLESQIEDLKKLQISKDAEIKKLNDQITSLENEKAKLKSELDSKIPIDFKQKEKEIEDKCKAEVAQIKKKNNL